MFYYHLTTYKEKACGYIINSDYRYLWSEIRNKRHEIIRKSQGALNLRNGRDQNVI